MKKLLLLIIVFTFSKEHVSAQILNASFENWNTVQFSEPDQWLSGNQESTSTLGNSPVTEVAGVSGSALRLETIVNENDTAQAFVTNGDPMSGEGGIPCSSLPTAITGNFRYGIPGNDTALLIVMFKKNGSIVGSNIIQIKGTGIQNTFVPFSYSLSSSLTPDSVIIAATCSNLLGIGGVTVGSFLEIDDLAFGGVSVTIPNGDFELWSTTSVDFISDWNSYGDVAKTTDVQDGNFAIMLSTADYGNGDIAAGQITNGNYTQNGTVGGIPFTMMSDTLCGYYKYYSSGSDSATISLSAKANGIMIAGGLFKLSPASQYTYFELPINSWSTPDSLEISISSSQWPYTPASVGSSLYIDNLALRSQLTAGIKQNENRNPFSAFVFPNPSTDVISIRTDQTLRGSAVVTIYDVSGSLVRNELVSDPGNTIELNVSSMATGRYFFKVICGNIVLQSSFTKN